MMSYRGMFLALLVDSRASVVAPSSDRLLDDSRASVVAPSSVRRSSVC